mmetsp:Transcript_29075/g.59471  ORF Transcript_29075/g.59471 Transcript_29075/m.59471 type:complete len:219 (-) Transcript_29075:234-890(-)
MVHSLEHRHVHVVGFHGLEDAQRGGEGHLLVVRAVDEAQRAGDGEAARPALQHQVLAPVHNQVLGDLVLVLAPRDFVAAFGHDGVLVFLAQVPPQQLFREVRVAAHPHHPRHQVGALHAHQKHHPRPHRGPDDDGFPRHHVVQELDGVLHPAADGAHVVLVLRHSVVVGAHVGGACLPAPGLHLSSHALVLGRIKVRQYQHVRRLLPKHEIVANVLVF